MLTSHMVGESLGCSVRFLGRRMRRKARMGGDSIWMDAAQDLEKLKG